MHNENFQVKSHLLVFIIFLACGLLAYLHTLNYEFAFDDFHNIVNNSSLGMEQLDASSFRDALNGPTKRPLAYLTFALNHYLSGSNTWSYRLVNIVLHVLNAMLVYTFALMTLTLLHDRTKKNFFPPPGTKFPFLSQHQMTAFFAALIWLLHPIQIQAVTYIVQRMVSLCTLFYLSAMCLYIYGRQTPIKRERLLPLH